MFIDYRNDIFLGSDDEARQKYLLMAADAGAEVIDVMGDLYSPDPLELTFDPAAVKKQMELIGLIHERGAKVIMSSHMTNLERSAEEVLTHLLEQSRRGADILKIVVKVDDEKALQEALRTMLLLHEKVEKPFVYLATGRFSRFIRQIGCQLGVAIEFAVHDYLPESTYSQLTIRAMKKVQNNFHWHIDNL
jgi:3-dehydroquinate dehydratase